MVAEMRSTSEEALVKARRVTTRESMTFGWDSTHIIPPKLSQTQPCSFYFDSAHPVLADHSSKQGWETWIEGEEWGEEWGKGRVPFHGL